MKRLAACLLLVIGFCTGASGVAAVDVGWMQTGVRAWYFGGVETGGPTSSDSEEAYLLGSIAGSSVQVTHHSALTHWTSPLPTVTQTYSLLDQGPWWIHPQALQNIGVGNYWLGQRITYVLRSTYTWATFPHHTLPINALFDLQAQREIVKLTYMMSDFQSLGTAYFDSDTGILLYYDTIWPTGEMFFVLSEINYDFAQHAAFAEDDGPHAGFHSWVNETSLGNGMGVGGGMVDFHSQVESRYGSDVEMWVITNLTGPTGFKPQAYENYAFFGRVPVVKRIAHDQAGSVRPEQWNPFGQHLWWWLPPAATGVAVANVQHAAEAVSTINVFDVPMTKVSDFPLTYAAAANPQRFFFTNLVFGNDGYLQVFSAKDPTIGLDVKPTDFIFGNQTVTDGPAYFRKSMTDDHFPPGGQIPDGWVTTPGADAGWLVAIDSSYKGSYSLKSADIGDNQAAGIEVSGTYQAGNVSFAVRVSSEQGHDYFAFYVDGEGEIGGAGDIDWTLVSIPVEAGTHTFTWRYFKNGGVSSGSDAAWIDAVVLPSTAAFAPTATTNAASVVTAAEATLAGTVSSNGASTTVTFEYGQTTGYGHGVTATQSPLPAGASNAPVSAAIAGLASNTAYHYRVVATNSAGAANGDDMTFTTVPSANANLANLVLSTGTLSPPFASGTLAYAASVVSHSNTITVTPTLADATATVTVNGLGVASGSPSAPITLSLGDNSVNVVVTAQDASTTKTYAVTVHYSVPVAPAPVLVGAASRKTHGSAGSFDLALSMVRSNPTIEPRTGPAHTIVFTFDKPVTAGTAQVSEGTATAGAPAFAGSEMRVALTGVINQQYVTVTLSNVNAADGGVGGAGSVRVGYLLGDVSQNRMVTLSDLGQVNAQIAQPVTAANYLKDVNASGTLSLSDKGITNTQITKTLPAP